MILFTCEPHETETEAPECIFSHDNAYAFLDMLGLSRAGGEVQTEDLPRIQRTLLRAINQHSCRREIIREPIVTKDFVDMGMPDEYVLERLIDLRNLVTYAQQHKLRLAWR